MNELSFFEAVKHILNNKSSKVKDRGQRSAVEHSLNKSHTGDKRIIVSKFPVMNKLTLERRVVKAIVQ